MSLIEKAKSGIVLDGAMSDELENQGVDTNNQLWTATALISQKCIKHTWIISMLALNL